MGTQKLYDESSVQKIANSIRGKNNSNSTYTIAEMSSAIDDLLSPEDDKDLVIHNDAVIINTSVRKIQPYKEYNDEGSNKNLSTVICNGTNEIGRYAFYFCTDGQTGGLTNAMFKLNDSDTSIIFGERCFARYENQYGTIGYSNLLHISYTHKGVDYVYLGRSETRVGADTAVTSVTVTNRSNITSTWAVDSIVEGHVIFDNVIKRPLVCRYVNGVKTWKLYIPEVKAYCGASAFSTTKLDWFPFALSSRADSSDPSDPYLQDNNGFREVDVGDFLIFDESSSNVLSVSPYYNGSNNYYGSVSANPLWIYGTNLVDFCPCTNFPSRTSNSKMIVLYYDNDTGSWAISQNQQEILNRSFSSTIGCKRWNGANILSFPNLQTIGTSAIDMNNTSADTLKMNGLQSIGYIIHSMRIEGGALAGGIQEICDGHDAMSSSDKPRRLELDSLQSCYSNYSSGDYTFINFGKTEEIILGKSYKNDPDTELVLIEDSAYGKTSPGTSKQGYLISSTQLYCLELYYNKMVRLHSINTPVISPLGLGLLKNDCPIKLYIGETTTEITANSTVKSIVVNGETINLTNKFAYATYSGKDWYFNRSKWVEYGTNGDHHPVVRVQPALIDTYRSNASSIFGAGGYYPADLFQPIS